MQEVDIQALDPVRLMELIGPVRAQEFETAAVAARRLLDGRRVVNVNSTATGGGVAELLQTLLAYARGGGVDARWHVIDGTPAFFDITKRIHNHLYGVPGDGGPLGPAEHAAYEEALRPNADEMLSVVAPGDIVLLHDPQTAGLAARLREEGARVVWRCHVGCDESNEHTARGWEFLRPYLDDVEAFVFTRREFAPDWIDPALVHVITPSLDPFAAKNQALSPEEVRGILVYTGLVADGGREEPSTVFTRRDGSRGRVDRRVDVLQTGPPPPDDAPLLVQVSRWDRMKDMPGVMRAFADHVDRSHGAHLTLMGPSVHGVADDPEGGPVLDECVELWRSFPEAVRNRIHLACVPMHDPDEVAIITNALQRHAAVVAQKSLAEGFGLTVLEAMWKHRPVVASRVGGITDQIVDRRHGLLIDDPTDLEAFGAAVGSLLADPVLAARLGAAAYERAHAEFLGDRHLERYAALFLALE
ncbi:MAG: glycosyltransferase [Acidimicrobiia bacterium]|nr:glycosyltransferase [Acidimicrobiia bacterium]